MTESCHGIGPDLAKYIYIPSTGRLTYAVTYCVPEVIEESEKKEARETNSRFYYYNMYGI